MDVKEWLVRYRDAVRNVELLEEEKESLYAPHTSKLTGMPKGSGTRVDTLGAKVGALERIAEQLNDARSTAEAILVQCLEAINKINGAGWPEQRAVLRLRYLEGLRWDEVNFLIFGRKDDFSLREDSYLRRLHRVHNAALEELEKVLQAITT